jgi:multisubunit Na+/H+ antiporter MnhG subunit
MWWPVYSGFILTLAAFAILLLGGLLALVGQIRRGLIRRIGVFVLMVGVGLLAGQNLGPSREALTQQPDGTMTIHLTSPVVAVASGPASCRNEATATEFSVEGDPNMRLDTPDQPFVQVYFNVGDRWDAIDDGPRKDGVRLDIGVTGVLVTDKGKPATVAMVAAPSSTLESTFANAGGSMHFGGLVPKTGLGESGESMDLAGTIEWTCGPLAP